MSPTGDFLLRFIAQSTFSALNGVALAVPPNFAIAILVESRFGQAAFFCCRQPPRAPQTAVGLGQTALSVAMPVGEPAFDITVDRCRDPVQRKR